MADQEKEASEADAPEAKAGVHRDERKHNGSRAAAQAVLAAALAYAARGWWVFPVRADKHPYKSGKYNAGRNWGMTRDPDEIRADFKRRPNAGIGLACEESGLWIVDIDKKRFDGFAELRKLTTVYGELPATLQAVSPSGSMHYYFAWPIDSTVIKSSTSEIAPGVDIRGHGGYVVLPPTARDGAHYQWMNDTPIAQAPGWLIELAKLQYVGDASDEPEADIELVRAAMAAIPNDDVDWATYNKIGMACFRATGGSDEGKECFHQWAQKSIAYRVANTKDVEERWKYYHSSPPDRIGFGTLSYYAREADPNWERAYDNEIMAKLREAARNARTKRGNGKAEPEQEEVEIKERLLTPLADFAAARTPPVYLVDGLIRQRFLYALTAPTNSGKTAIAIRLAIHVAAGLALLGREVAQGIVLYFAGENPDDVRDRFIKQCEEMKLELIALPIYILAGNPPLGEEAMSRHVAQQGVSNRAQIEQELESIGPVSLLIIDTNSAFFKGDDENNNVQAGNHARMLRSYVELVGGPTILATCHPTKNFAPDNLLPRGGGAFVNELDGNLVVETRQGIMLGILTWHGKFRGADFSPIGFKYVTGKSEKIKDSKGRLIWTVTATPISSEESEAMENASEDKQFTLLQLLAKNPGSSIAQLAELAGWRYSDDKPNKSLVQRLVNKSIKERLVAKRLGQYTLTPKGKEHLKDTEAMPL